MLLLTWHGTILRVEQSQNRLIHAPLTPVRTVARDFAFTDTLPGGLVLHPGPHPGAAHISRNGKTLRITPDVPYPSFDTAPPTPLLPLTEAEIATLRALLGTPQYHRETGRDLPPARLEPGFTLTIGDDWRVNLVEARPADSPHGIALPAGAGTLVARKAELGDTDIGLHPAEKPPQVSDAAAFQAAASASLAVHGGTEYSFLPLAGSHSARDWFYTAAKPPRPGRHTRTSFVRRAADAFVLTMAGSATVFGRQGVFDAPPPPDAQPPYPAGVAREADVFFVAESAMADAPRLPGTYALLPQPESSLLLDTVMALMLMAPHLPPDTTLFIPGDIPDGLAELLGLFNLDHLTVAAAPGPLCCIERLIWPDACEPGQLPADILRDARARAAPNLPPSASRRLFLTNGIANVPRLAAIAATFGFETIAVLPTQHTARAALFASSQAIIATSSSALENLLFCPAGTQVLELAENTVWRAAHAQLSDQLGLVHAVLPSAGGAHGLSPEPAAFGRLLRILQARG